MTTTVGSAARLQGAVSDPDGDALEIRWIRTVVAGASLATCTFTGPTAFEPATPAGLAPTMTGSQPGAYLLQLVVGDGVISDDDTGALVTFTPARDRSPAQCLAVRPRSGPYILRLQDLQSGVAGFPRDAVRQRRAVAVRQVLPGAGRADRHRGVAAHPVVPRGAFIKHINGAGVEGSCFVVSAADGTLSGLPWP